MNFINETEMKELIESSKALPLKGELEIQNMETLLENQAKYINEESTTSDIAGFDNILVPAVRRIMPALFAKELVSIQPMSGPTGHVYAQRFFYAGSKDEAVSTGAVIVVDESTFDGTVAVGDTVYTDYTVEYVEAGKAIVAGGTSSNLPSTGVYSTQAAFKQILKSYSGTYSTSAGETLGSAMRQVKFTIDRVTVTAQTRKLKSEYTVELIQDLQSQHGMSAEAELLNLIEFELQADIDQEILGLVKSNAVAMPTVAVAGVTGNTEAAKFQAIYTQIINACEKIVQDTKRGAGNVVVASPKVIAALSLTGKLDSSATALNNNVQTGATQGVAFVGTLDNGAKVFRDSFAMGDEVLVAYKGATAADAGAFFAPYIPLMVQKATNAETLQPVVACMTRYGLIENPLSSDSEGNPYYRSFAVDFASTTLA